MNQTIHPIDAIPFDALCGIIETDYEIRAQEGKPVPNGRNGDETFYQFAHHLRANLRLAFDAGIIESGRAAFPTPNITAYAADRIRAIEADDANGPGYWDRLEIGNRGRIARALRDRINLALAMLNRKLRVKTLPDPPANEAEFWKSVDAG
jgi:hypothetical protein